MPVRPQITEDQLQGFKYFKKLPPLLDRLHDHATGRDKAGNRILHYDQYIALQLLFFFNPVVTSMRGLVQASELKKVQRTLGVSPTSLGSFSEAGSVFDSELIKLHTRFEPLVGVPVDMDLTAAGDSEIESLFRHLLPGRVYVKDRGYACFRLFQGIIDIGSHFVCRIRDNSVCEVIEDRPLSAEARAAGIISDQVVWLGRDGKRDELKQPLRVIKIKCKPHRKRSGHTGRGGPEQGEWLLIATNLMDLPAEVVALVFRQRWTVELFFRFFKHILGCRHLLSHRANGIEIQVYLAIIVCMLIALWTGKKPTLRTVEMIRFYFIGWADVDELEAHIARLQKTGR